MPKRSVAGNPCASGEYSRLDWNDVVLGELVPHSLLELAGKGNLANKRQMAVEEFMNQPDRDPKLEPGMYRVCVTLERTYEIDLGEEKTEEELARYVSESAPMYSWTVRKIG